MGLAGRGADASGSFGRMLGGGGRTLGGIGVPGTLGTLEGREARIGGGGGMLRRAGAGGGVDLGIDAGGVEPAAAGGCALPATGVEEAVGIAGEGGVGLVAGFETAAWGTGLGMLGADGVPLGLGGTVTGRGATLTLGRGGCGGCGASVPVPAPSLPPMDCAVPFVVDAGDDDCGWAGWDCPSDGFPSLMALRKAQVDGSARLTLRVPGNRPVVHP